MSIGKCELCGRESNQAARGHIICTNCEGVLKTEFWGLELDEPARKAYERARVICEFKAEIRELKAEIESLRKRLGDI